VALGERHTLLLREDGKVFGCGGNQYGQLGIGVKGGNVLSLSEIAIDVPDPTTPQRTAPIPNNGACGYSLSAFGLTLLCVCSTWMWF